MERLRHTLLYIVEKKTLLFCIWTAFLFRMLAAFFSRGIAFGYEHYVYLENAQQLLSGQTSLSEFLYGGESTFIQHGYSLLYLCVNWLALFVGEFFGIFDPRSKMFVIRLVHALASLLTVYYSYRIVRLFSTRKVGLAVGLTVAVLWIEPFISVRNFAENVSAILLLAGFYRLAKYDPKKFKFADDLFTGFLMAIGFSVSYHSGVFILGVFISMIIRGSHKRAMYFLLGAFVSAMSFEGLVGSVLFHEPFYMLSEYVQTILSGRLTTNGSSAYYMYISILIVMFLFPWGMVAFYGFIRSWKKYFMIFFPVCFYIVVHYLIPYKQERFMLNILPFYIILVVAGLYNFRRTSEFFVRHSVLSRWVVLSFVIVNIPLLIITSTAYMRRPQVESMLFLSKYRQSVKSIFVDDPANDSSKSFPPFYFGGRLIQYVYNRQPEPDSSIVNSYQQDGSDIRYLFSRDYFVDKDDSLRPSYVFFYGNYDIEQRAEAVRRIFPDLTFVEKIDPSLSDLTIEYFNNTNLNPPVYIYSTVPE
ncbi:MAG: glycosyltransferase family 39 protein [Bacteroidales bacterium]|nr:glycosyltransferase family 39 protein [Bacteroidales bacterium]